MGKDRLRQGLACLGMGVGGWVTGLAMGFTSPALPKMMADPDFSITEEQGSWVGSILPAMALLGSLAAGPMVDSLGRRMTLIALMIPFALSWVSIAVSPGIFGVIFGRMVAGFCVGVQTVAGNVFLPEVIAVQNRNLQAIPAFMGCSGLLLTFWAGANLTWRGLAWLGCIMCVPSLLFYLPLPETPYFLTSTGRTTESLAALEWLYDSKPEAEKEQEELTKATSSKSKEAKVTISECFTSPNRWPVVVAMSLMITQQFTGINAVIFYGSTIFKSAGAGIDDGTAQMLLGACNMIATLIGIGMLGTYQRKYLLRKSNQGLLASFAVLILFFTAKELGGSWAAMVESFSFLSVVAVLTYIFTFAVGWGPIPWVFSGEGLPSRVRGVASSLTIATSWAFAAVITKTFSMFNESLGIHYTFTIYALLTAICYTILDPYIPETFQKSPLDMDKFYIEECSKKNK